MAKSSFYENSLQSPKLSTPQTPTDETAPASFYHDKGKKYVVIAGTNPTYYIYGF